MEVLGTTNFTADAGCDDIIVLRRNDHESSFTWKMITEPRAYSEYEIIMMTIAEPK
jgi:hypothetical protein